MNNIKLVPVNEENFQAVVKMKLEGEQANMVAPNLYSLAQAWLYYDKARPFAIYKEEKVIGFIMLDWDEDGRTVGLWRFMIAQDEQGKGYGKASLIKMLELIRAEKKFDLVYLDYVENNKAARALYYSVGFRETGEVDEGEVIMELPLTNEPKVGFTKADEDDIDNLRNIYDQCDDQKVDFETIEKAIKKGEVKCFTLMGKAIGFRIKNYIIVSKEHCSYMNDILKVS